MGYRILKRMPDRQKLICIAIALLLAFLFLPPFFFANIYPVNNADDAWRSLDPSWLITLNYVNQENFMWGSEFAFTYGPLSYLSTRVGWGASRYAFLIYDLFIAFNFFAVFYTALRQSKDKVLISIWILAMVIILPASFGVSISMVLLGFLVFWIYKSLEKDTFFYNIMQIAIIVLLFYMKFNAGLVTFVFYAVAMAYKAIFRVQKMSVIFGYAALLAAAIMISARALNVYLPSYAASGLEFVSGYNDAMGYWGDVVAEQVAAAIFIILPGLVLLSKFIKHKKERFKTLLVLFFYGSSMFIMYKQSFVRQDLGHVLEIFKTGLFILFCTIPLYNFKLQKFTAVVSAIVIAIPVWVLVRLEPTHFSIAGRVNKEYVKGFSNFTPTSGLYLFPNNNQLPQEILGKIGNSTVDVFPWNTSMLFENKLNYVPRPVMQAYAAYTPYLANLNFEHYNSRKAPQFVIFDLMTIDSRYALLDDAKVNIVLMKNYRIASTFDYFGRELLLLEKRPEAKPLVFEKAREYAMYIDAPLIPKKGMYYEVVPYHSLKGKAVSIFDRSPEIMLVANAENGQPTYFRTSAKLLESGVFSDKAIYNVKDFARLMEGKETDSIPQVEYYTVRPDNRRYFGDKIRIREYIIK